MEKINSTLSIVLLDNDVASLSQMEQLINNLQIANVVATFNNSAAFIKELPMLNFDLLMLDIEMAGTTGREVIKKVGRDKCIINTGHKHRYEEAIKCHPIDILLKPVYKKALNRALDKAKKIIPEIKAMTENKYLAFNTAKRGGKVFLLLQDIVFVTTDKDGPRNKLVIMRDGSRHILMNYTIDELHNTVPHLLRPNTSSLISPEIVLKKGFNYFELTVSNEEKKKIVVNITRKFGPKLINYNTKG
ncbi:MAG TPA: response regulator [Bacteroidia bacterium]|jgi:DNA-binding LytR/AlgR family response regulator|nr:response regulator [Bacteroidia bacterium]